MTSAPASLFFPFSVAPSLETLETKNKNAKPAQRPIRDPRCGPREPRRGDRNRVPRHEARAVSSFDSSFSAPPFLSLSFSASFRRLVSRSFAGFASVPGPRKTPKTKTNAPAAPRERYFAFSTAALLSHPPAARCSAADAFVSSKAERAQGTAERPSEATAAARPRRTTEF